VTELASSPSPTAGAGPPRAYEGELLVPPGEEDVATDPFEGAGVLSSWKDVVTAGNAGELAAAATNAELATLGGAMNPLDALVGAGVGWFIEHIWFLHEPLDVLAGDPVQIAAHARTWENLSKALVDLAADYRVDVDRLSGWDGAAAIAYRQAASDYVAGLRQGARSAFDVSGQVMGAGATVGAVRALVRDVIADFVTELVPWGLRALALSGPSAGASLAAFTGWVTRATVVAARVADRIAELVDELAAAATRLARTVDDMGGVARTFTPGGELGFDAALFAGTSATELWKQHERAGTTAADWQRKVREQRP
jgi:hypothetical protein